MAALYSIERSSNSIYYNYDIKGIQKLNAIDLISMLKALELTFN